MPRESRVHCSNALIDRESRKISALHSVKRSDRLTRKAVGTSEPVRVEAMYKLRRHRREVPRPPDDLDSPPERTVRVQEPLDDKFAFAVVVV